jgi:Tfp pilus assembly protein PilX
MINFRQTNNKKNPQRGVALIATILTLVLIAAITAGMIILSTTDTNISANFKDEQRAYFSAKAGIEEARDRLRNNTIPASDTLRVAGTLPATLPGGSGSVLYILNPLNGETVAPWNGSGNAYADDEICKENTTISCSTGTTPLPQLSSCTGWCKSVTASTTYAASPILDWKWVRITLKQNNQISPFNINGSSSSTYNTYQACWNGTNEYADSTLGCTPPNEPVYLLTALAVTPSGSRRMVQAEVAEDKLNFQTPSTLTLPGATDNFSGGNSAGWGVSGTDVAGCGSITTGGSVPAIGVVNAGDVTSVDAGIPGGRKGNYGGTGASPDVENVSSTMSPSLQTVSGLQNLVSTIKNNVTQPVINGPASGLSNPGTTSAPQIIGVNGNLSLSGNTTGYGILVVTGTLNVTGNVNWNGLILVIGQGVFNSSGTPQYNGAIVVAQTLDALGNPLSVVGPPTASFNINGGGNGGVQYSSACVAQATQLSTFHAMVFRELMD